MAIPRKGSRTVRVGDAVYRWRIRKTPTYIQGAFESSMTLAVELCTEGASSVLVVNLKVSRPDNWIAPHQTAVKPAMVTDMIGKALAAGWKPASPGKPFELDYPLIMDRS
jgi:hypothetical protein